MKKKSKKKNQGSLIPRSIIPMRVPRRVDVWISQILSDPVRWNPFQTESVWFQKLSWIAKEYNCVLVYDIFKPWYQSVYLYDTFDEPVVLVGGVPEYKHGITAALHELSHHILKVKKHEPKNKTELEREAWILAEHLATEYQLPFLKKIRKKSLYSYKYADLIKLNLGSKQKNKRQGLPHTWKMLSSKRSTGISKKYASPPIVVKKLLKYISTEKDLEFKGLKTNLPIGKKGNRKVKKYIKHQIHRKKRNKGKEIIQKEKENI